MTSHQKWVPLKTRHTRSSLKTTILLSALTNSNILPRLIRRLKSSTVVYEMWGLEEEGFSEKTESAPQRNPTNYDK